MEVIEEENLIFKSGDTGIFLGKFSDSVEHKHDALQLTISIHQKFKVTSDGKALNADALVIQSGASHRLDSMDQPVLVLFFNPASTVGHFLGKHLTTKAVQKFEDEWADQLRMFCQDLLKNEINQKTFLSACINSMAEFNDRCLQSKFKIEKRLLATLQYLDRHTREMLSLKEIAEEMCLSQEKFSEMFESSTGISYAKSLQWKCLMQSMERYEKAKTLTKLAKDTGFKDSSEYTEVLNNFLGMTPEEAFGETNLEIR